MKREQEKKSCKTGATFEECLAYADTNKLETTGEKAKEYAIARQETSFHKKI
ncbi:hypothetical protein [Treponema sp. Marseille-Q4523]|uniref:hypothetical protein n=1 Tax=Treponema sp. Marseille-Q4523 TaxID=2810610 RepID=UPI001961E4A0|nr:hypothetical protein [Treponema sp. Marseille-Q4523]MBM7023944.1 hypothetical protein [Treponema sp. Marseille-Q4523]